MASNSERDFKAELEAALHEDAQTKAVIRKKYSVHDAVRRTTDLITVIDDTLGEVRFGILTIEEFQKLDFSECKTDKAMLEVVIAGMLKKADPEVTLADIKHLPIDDYPILVGILTKHLPGFLALGQQVLEAQKAKEAQMNQQNSKNGLAAPP